MSNGLTNEDQQVLIFVLRENIASLEAKIKRMEDNLITDCEPCPFDEAATTLQKYTNKIEAELLTHQWVDIKDRLPEEYKYGRSGWVLVFRDLPHAKEEQDAIDLSRYMIESKKWPYDNDIITHWKPITLPPEKEGE